MRHFSGYTPQELTMALQPQYRDDYERERARCTLGYLECEQLEHPTAERAEQITSIRSTLGSDAPPVFVPLRPSVSATVGTPNAATIDRMRASMQAVLASSGFAEPPAPPTNTTAMTAMATSAESRANMKALLAQMGEEPVE